MNLIVAVLKFEILFRIEPIFRTKDSNNSLHWEENESLVLGPSQEMETYIIL